MKLKINSNLVDNYKVFIRRAGYALIFDRRRGVESFVRRLGSGHYPRLHMYIDEAGSDLIFSLHLDQKKASYEGHHMHNAEYDNDIVENEINRLKSLLGISDNRYLSEKESNVSDNKDFNDKIKDIQPVNDSFSGNLEDDLARLQKPNKKKKRFLFFNI
ncbi:MAG TPA: hypothetical protein PK142_01605 [bacterium]|nr:hypothetical protein [bacterium]